MPMHVVTVKRWQVVGAFLAVAASFVYGAWVFTGYNNDRIRDIQQNRLVSCEQTYEGVREVFRPFFRPFKERTAKERRDIVKFNDTVDRLKARCDVQVATKGKQ